MKFVMLDGKGQPTTDPLKACGWALKDPPKYAGACSTRWKGIQ